MNELEGQYTPTSMQHALGAPLPSEQRTGHLLPRVLSPVDLLALFITSVLYIPTVSIVDATHGVGIATYLYWVLGTVTFLLPGVIVTGQLTRFMPVDGSIYVWTHRALGPLWGFLAGFFAWFAGILALLSACIAVLVMVDGIGRVWLGASSNWLAAPWQQGLFVVGVLLLAGWLSTWPLRLIMRIAKIVILLYLLGIAVVGLGGIVWLLGGHPPQPALTTSHHGVGMQSIVLFSVIVLGLLGVEVPFNMTAETTQPYASRLFLRWGPPLVLLAYLLGTFGVQTVVPERTAGVLYSTLIAVQMVFGIPAAVTVGCSFVCFFVMTAVLYHVAFARILFVAALDQRLPAGLAKLNRFAAPSRATTIQTIIALTIVVSPFLVGSLVFPLQMARFSLEVYAVAQATTAVIWCLSMLILFLDLPILLGRFRTLLESLPDQLIAPRWILYLCAAGGGMASLVGIWTTFTQSWEPELISTAHWVQSVGLSVLILLAIGLLGAAYPRLWARLEKQTAAARENARLYTELSVAHAQLRELDQLKDAFLLTASHEFRTPLTIMQGYLELLREMEDASPDMRRSFLDKASRACDELVLLQANIMDASRLAVDAATLHFASVALRDICTAVIDLFEPWIIQQQRSIEVNIAPSMLVWADEMRLRQVLHNLMANALRYSPPQTPIRVTAAGEQEAGMVRVSVIDRGLGIPADKQEVIFDKFVRLDRDMYGTVRGSGLGLFITRQLVEAMGGTITVESSGITGEGSTFLFTLPMAKRAE
jgi:signal transduction histidine kinase/L-asparagine transporter-like permease